MLIVQCDQACDSISFLVDFMNEGGQKLADVIELTEKDADQTRRDLISYVQNTFITPLDRHDLFALSRSFDDLTDAVKDLKDFILFFEFAPTAKNIEMATLTEESINLLTASMDKKIIGDKITLVVPENFGKCRLQRISLSELKQFIELGIEN